MKIYRTEEVVRYRETDQMKVAHHSSYLFWFEIGRTGLLRESGHLYKQMEENGAFLPVVEYSCRLPQSVGYDDRVIIEAWINELRSRTIEFAYRISHRNHLIAEGVTKHLCVDGNNKYKRIPEEIVKSLKDYVQE